MLIFHMEIRELNQNVINFWGKEIQKNIFDIIANKGNVHHNEKRSYRFTSKKKK